MARGEKKLKVKTQKNDTGGAPPPAHWPSVQGLRREIDSLFEDFDWGFWRSPVRRAGSTIASHLPHGPSWAGVLAIDLVEQDKLYKITAELPGMEEKDIELKLTNSMLTIRGEKKEEKEEKKKGYYLSERRYGSFERRLQVPYGVDTSKIDASFKNGVLTILLPKTADAQKPEKKISIKAA